MDSIAVSNLEKHSFRAWLLSLLLLCLPATNSIAKQPAAIKAIPDIRVMIDVSGSMKKNDPGKLRQPALRLLAGLLPRNSRSGVWTFGQWVNMQVKHGKVTDSWKKLARQQSYKIHSLGLRTNIEEAIKRSTFGWNKKDPRYRRTLIILTDGMVDVSKKPALNKASRQRILSQLLPRLRKAGVTIHTIALSENADHELMRMLSVSTGGWYEKAKDARKLQNIFLRLFEKSADTQALPLENNRFRVDSSITDMTLLVFRNPGDKQTVIIAPDGKKWSFKYHPKFASWHHEKGYDLVTIRKPARGNWRINAAVNDSNRVMVATNLRLQVSQLPNYLLKDEQLQIRVNLLKKDKPVTRRDFLKLIRFLLDIKQDDTRQSYPILDNGVAPDTRKLDGHYAISYKLATKGRHEIRITVKGPTFQRQRIHHLQVYDAPVSMAFRQLEPGKPISVVIKGKPGLVRPDNSRISINTSDGEKKYERLVEKDTLTVEIPGRYAGKEIHITVKGMRYNNRLLNWSTTRTLPGIAPVTKKKPAEKRPITKKAPVPAKPPEKKPVPAKPVPEKKQAPEKKPASDKHSDRGNAESSGKDEAGNEGEDKPAKDKNRKKDRKKKKNNWILISLSVVLINTLIAVLGWFGYRYWKKKSAQDVLDDDKGSEE